MKIIIIEYFVKDMGFLGIGRFLVADLNILIIKVNIYDGFSLIYIFHLTVRHERIVHQAQPSWLSIKGNERDRSTSLTNIFVQNVVRTKQRHTRRCPSVPLMFLPHFDVFWDLFTEQITEARNLPGLCNKETKQCS